MTDARLQAPWHGEPDRAGPGRPPPRAGLAASPLRPQTNACRVALDLSGTWLLRLGDGDGDWRGGVPGGIPVGVPGSWNDQVPGARDDLGPGWYERRFEAPPLAGRDAAIRLGSVHYQADVWLNGCYLGGHEGGHLPFAVSCAHALRDGENVLVVRADGQLGTGRLPPGLVPQADTHGRVFHPDVPFDFFPFAGIHRRVELVLAPRDGIRDIRVSAMLTAGGEALLAADVDAGEGDVTLTLDGVPVGPGHLVPRDALWSPTSPRLHLLEAELRRGGALADRYSLRAGVRVVAVDGDRLLLNGDPVRLRGFGRHEDFPVLGRGTAPAVAARDLLAMRQLGANSFRTAHYPCDEDTLDIADQLGLMVIAETPAVGLYFSGDDDEPRRQELALAALGELISRDRNRACVIAWSVANEPHEREPAASAALAQLCGAARALDPSRPASYAAYLPDAAGIAACDVVFLNAYPGWYQHPGQLGVAEDALAATLDRIRARHAKPVIVTETGADAIPGTHADPPSMWSEEYQAELLARLAAVAASRDFVAGFHVWCLADFATAQADHRPGSLNFKGVLTRDRRPKLAAARLRQLWQEWQEGPPPA